MVESVQHRAIIAVVAILYVIGLCGWAVAGYWVGFALDLALGVGFVVSFVWGVLRRRALR